MNSLNKKVLLLIWGASALTKGVFVFIGMNANLQNSHEMAGGIAVLFFLGLFTAVAGTILSFYIHRSETIYKNKTLISLYRKQSVRTGWKIEDTIYFSLFTVSNGLAEATALFGLIGYILFQNFQYFATMLVISLIGWVLVFPKPERYEDIQKKLTNEQ